MKSPSRTVAHAMFAASALTFIGAIASVLLTAWVGTRLFDRSTGILGASMLASSLLLSVQARLAIRPGP